MTETEERTFYELLGVETTATTDEIKESYREIARIFHPDSNFYSDIIADAGPDDNDVFKAITAAYQVLINEQKRKEYDESLNLDLYTGWDEGQSGKDEDVPEEWRKEREFFQENFEEILKPAPKVDLVGSEEAEAEARARPPIDDEDGDVDDEPEVIAPRRGSLSRIRQKQQEVESDIPFISSLPKARRPHRLPRDPVDLLLYVGLPIMFLIVLVEIFLFYS